VYYIKKKKKEGGGGGGVKITLDKVERRGMNCKTYQQILINHAYFSPRLENVQNVLLRNW